MITHSAGDIEDYSLFSHAPSIAVHFCQPGNINKPFPLWKYKSKFANESIVTGAIKAKKLRDSYYLAAFCCITEDGSVNEEVLRAGLVTIFKKAEQLGAIVYFQYRPKHFTESVLGFIRGYAGAVVCYLSKADNKAGYR